MKTYVTLLTFTDQGVRKLRESPRRAKSFEKSVAQKGITVVSQLWTAGAYDGVLILQAESEEKILGALAELAALGNVRTQSLRAFDADEWSAMISGRSEKTRSRR